MKKRKRKQGERGMPVMILAGIVVALATLAVLFYASEAGSRKSTDPLTRESRSEVEAPGSSIPETTAPVPAVPAESAPEGEGPGAGGGGNKAGSAEEVDNPYPALSRDLWNYILDRAIALNAKQDLINRIDAVLAQKGSPLAGLGHCFVTAQESYGVSAALLVALTAAESTWATDGSLSRTNHNAWGMKGPQPALGIPAAGGYCWWPDWGTAINDAARFVLHYWGTAQNAGQLRGYCAGNPPEWLQTVEGARRAILE